MGARGRAWTLGIVNKGRLFIWVAAVFVTQGIIFGGLLLIGPGIPFWFELPYVPFQAVFVRLFGSAWAVGLPVGALVGAITYSVVFGLVLARVLSRRHHAHTA